MKLINLTGCTLKINGADVQPAQADVEISTETKVVGDLDGTPVLAVVTSEVLVNGLPFPSSKMGVTFIVDKNVAQLLTHRCDVLSHECQSTGTYGIVSAFRTYADRKEPITTENPNLRGNIAFTGQNPAYQPLYIKAPTTDKTDPYKLKKQTVSAQTDAWYDAAEFTVKPVKSPLNLQDKSEFPDIIDGHKMSSWEPIWGSNEPADARHRVCVNCGAEQIVYLDSGEIENSEELQTHCIPSHLAAAISDVHNALKMLDKITDGRSLIGHKSATSGLQRLLESLKDKAKNIEE